MIERKSKRIFLIGYVSLMIIMVIMSSCGTSSQCYNVGTGKPMTQTCGGTGWYGGQQYEKDNNKYNSFIYYFLWNQSVNTKTNRNKL